MTDVCGPALAAADQVSFWFGMTCLIVGFVIGIVMDRAGRLVRQRYGWFNK
jgi:hypothetical protein